MPVPKEQWPEAGRMENMIEVWLSNRYMAQVFNEGEGVLRVSVCRTSIDAAGIWEQNLSWDELMDIKRQICHSDSYAVEVLPPDPDIVNIANLRHFWILPQPVVGWSRSASKAA